MCSAPLHMNALLTDRLDWNLLRTFMVIMQERSISLAAARLHLTQPAVSLALKRLEEAVGHQLITRRGHSFGPTAAGMEAYAIACEIYGQVSRLQTELNDKADDVTGSVRLLSVSRLDCPAYDDFLAEFHRSYPRIDLQVEVLRSSDIISALLRNAATAGVSLCRLPEEHLERKLFMRQRYAIFCGRHHPLFGRRSLEIKDLLDENSVAFTTELLGEHLSPLTVFRETHGFTGRTVAVSSSLDEVRRLIYAGYGIGCLPEHMVQQDIQQQRLWRLPPEEGVADIDIFLLWQHARKMTAAERVFLDSVQRALPRFAG